MRKKLLVLSALTCIAGGFALAEPAVARHHTPPCSSLVGMRCSGGYMACTLADGQTDDWLICFNGTWHWA